MNKLQILNFKWLPAIVIASFLWIVTPLMSTAQSSGDGTMELGDWNLNFSVGAGNRMWASDYAVGPALKISFEKGMWKAGPGVITLGGEYTFAYFWKNHGNDWHENRANMVFGARGAYHYGWGVKGLDTYAGVPIGFGFSIHQNKDNDHNTSSVDFFPNAGFFAGAAYYFTDRFGVFGEVGYNSTFAAMGIVLKLK